MGGFFFAFSVFEITQQSASALSHGLLNLTKHKKCYVQPNIADYIYRQTIRLALHVEGTTGGGGEKKRRGKKKKKQRVHHGFGFWRRSALISLVVSQKWRKMSLIYLAY